MGDGAADSTGKGEAGVQSKAGELLGLGSSLDILDDGIDLDRAGSLRSGSHCDCDWTERLSGEGDSKTRNTGFREIEDGGTKRQTEAMAFRIMENQRGKKKCVCRSTHGDEVFFLPAVQFPCFFPWPPA